MVGSQLGFHLPSIAAARRAESDRFSAVFAGDFVERAHQSLVFGVGGLIIKPDGFERFGLQPLQDHADLFIQIAVPVDLSENLAGPFAQLAGRIGRGRQLEGQRV